MATGDPEAAATTVRLLLAHLTWTSKRLLAAMVLDRMDVELAATRLDADVCHAAVANSPLCQSSGQRTNESARRIAESNW